ncbi:MAG: pyridoxamine 5'-phosphate oxidase family protein [Lawsonibacter sp.]|jgi:nitroimidazol reductase NimA-like FMN-containing flavoprotein (pyridoxamine 5'-phosphate oxidase superfamily)
MRRKDRQQSREFALELIDRCSHGVMAISTCEDTPYCLPLSLVRIEDRLYFHCAREGRKVDLLRTNPRVCITFVGEDLPAFVEPAMYTTYFQSAIVTGTAQEVSDPEEKIAALRALCQKLMPKDMAGFDRAIEASLPATAVWRIDIDSISGKAKLKH